MNTRKRNRRCTRKRKRGGAVYNPDDPKILMTDETIRGELQKYVLEDRLGEISQWDVSQVTDMFNLFENMDLTDVDFTGWDVSEVIDMQSMFREAKNIPPLNHWNTSKVTDMSFMFYECKGFNQPLNNWRTDSVTNMSNMFEGCIRFNQPLTNWNTGRVTDMTEMFMNCRDLFQDFTGWTVDNVVSHAYMFADSGQEDLLPPFRDTPVDAFQVHKAASNINYEELNGYLEDILKDAGLEPTLEKKLGHLPNREEYKEFIRETIQSMIDRGDDATEIVKRTDQLTTLIGQKLGIRYDEISTTGFYADASAHERQQARELIRSIYCTLTYASIQSKEFIETYVKNLLNDCSTAYAGEGVVALSCSKGILERFTLGLVSACVVENTKTAKPNAEYTHIVELIELTPLKVIKEAVRDWFVVMKSKEENKYPTIPEDIDASTKTELIASRKNDLKNYIIAKLVEKIKMTPDKIAENDALIESYMPVDDADYEDDAFAYEGGRRRKCKRPKTKKNKRRSYRKRIR
jgi:surface protein